MSELVQYLRSRPFHPLLLQLRERYEGLGRIGGSVAVPPESVPPLAGFLGHPVGDNRVRLAEVDAALQRSRFACTLPEALAAYFGEPMVTRAEAAAAEQQRWQQVLAELAAEQQRWQQALAELAAAAPPAGSSPSLADRPDPLGWLTAEGTYLQREWRKRPVELAAAARLVGGALLRLPAPDEPLPVFANRLAGDPHALDRLAGRLWLRALAWLYPEAALAARSPAEQRLAWLAAAGLAADDVSSSVVVAGLIGEAGWLLSARAAGVALALPLRSIAEGQTYQGWRGVAFVVENPPVFSQLLDAMAGLPAAGRPTLICTSGQLSLAARRLLGRLVAGGTTLRYSGDFDAAGLGIARGCLQRYGDACRLWRLDPEDYRRALRHPAPAVESERLELLRSSFPQLVPPLLAGGAAYQEALVPALVADLLRFAADSAGGD